MDEVDPVFRALADPSRRLLLDRLLHRDGQTLGELETALEMSRFGVMKHLRVLEEAELVITRRSGRSKLHFLNPVPVRRIHDRWITRYTEQRASMLADLKTRLEGAVSAPPTTQVFRVHIRASAQAVWEAITDPAWSARYGYGPMAFDLRPGGDFHSEPNENLCAAGMSGRLVEGQVVEVDPPRRLVQTYRLLFDAAATEPPTRVTWELEPAGDGVTRLTVVHELDGAPEHARLVTGDDPNAGGGWPFVLSGLKSLLETGEGMPFSPTVSGEDR